MSHKVITFYKYVPINNPEQLRDNLKAYCFQEGILGRILLAEEGLNGAVCGKITAIEKFTLFLNDNPLFSDVTFREEEVEKNTYHKLVVRVRKEMVHFGAKVNLDNRGKYLTPTELKLWYDRGKDFVIVDARNDYEYEVGHFKEAIKMPIKTFKEFPSIAPKELAKYKDKKIVLFCTGGIRCEKASAYLKQQDFPEVYHVKGGVLDYMKEYSEYWERGCFVFDNRLVSGKPITRCVHCHQESEALLNCHNLDCDRFVVSCQSCQEKTNKSCSTECMQASRRRKEKKALEVAGVVEHFYPKKNIALVRVEKSLQKNSCVIIQGKTTLSFSQAITEMKDEEGRDRENAEVGELITLPVLTKVRKHDRVMVEL